MDKRMKGDRNRRWVLLSVPTGLHLRIKTVAGDTDRTIGEVIVEALEQAMAKQRKAVKEVV